MHSLHRIIGGKIIALLIGVFVVMMLPGYLWSKVFFDKPGHKSISLVERTMWSALLSLVIVPMAFITINDLFAIPVSPFSVTLFIGMVCFPAVLVSIRTKRSNS